MSVAVIGSGAFGTALAIALSANGPVTLWSRSVSQVAEMLQRRENSERLPGAKLPEAVTPCASFEALEPCDTLLIAVPMQKLRAMATDRRGALAGRALIACCKGMELETGVGPVDVLREAVPDATTAILTGPSFAVEIAAGKPTALTLACADEEAGEALQSQLSTKTLRIYRSSDVTGAQLGGALKNVMAIACGAVIGAGLGNSARAALMTRGYAEMLRLAVALGADPATLAGLSGLGDLALTCTSEQSRNFRLGLAIGRQEAFDPTVTVEGAATARSVAKLSRKMGIELPVTEAVAALVTQKQSLNEVISQLLARSLKPE